MTSAAPSAQPSSPPRQTGVSSPPPTSPPNKRDIINLKSFWKSFRLPKPQEHNIESKPQGIFGVPLRQSITYANVAISLVDEQGQSYIYGYVPIVVAKCGVFLKEKATGIEGIFRLSGSEKRIKELKTIFDSPDRYGKGLVWDGYTVHDAANVFRRYLNDLPEPVVPLDRYEKFREPLRGATKQAVGDAEGPQFVENFDEPAAISRYQQLITELPPLNRQLLLYILDLLAVFAAKSDENRMTSQNLAAIFQPGMLSHPSHAMAPDEYRLNQCVIIFLIENQDHFLIGMQGTAADEKTMKEVQSGPTPTSTRRSGAGLGRSASNASAGAQSVLRDGQIRRNRSVTSRKSRPDENTQPSSPALSTTQTGGLGRSNTVPSKKSPAVAAGKFRRQENTGANATNHPEPAAQPPSSSTPRISEHSSVAPAVGATVASGPAPSQERLLGVPADQSTPTRERNISSMFQRTSTDDSKRQPNKLKKKRIPGAMNQSAQSSSASLPYHGSAISPSGEHTNPLDRPPIQQEEQLKTPPQSSTGAQGDLSSEATPRASAVPPNTSLEPEGTLKSKTSQPTSLQSSFVEGSDAGQGAEAQVAASSESQEKEKTRPFQISSAKKDDGAEATPPPAERNVSTSEMAERSQTSLGSSSAAAQKPRMSFTGESAEPSTSTVVTSDTQHSKDDLSKDGKDKEERKGLFGRMKNKLREAKETAEQRRNKSPPSEHSHTSLLSRGKSVDIKRDAPAEKKEAPSPAPLEEKQPVIQEPTVPEEPEPAPTQAPQNTVEQAAEKVPEEKIPDAPVVPAAADTAEVLKEAPKEVSEAAPLQTEAQPEPPKSQ